MLESSRFLKKQSTMNHSKRQKGHTNQIGTVGGHHIAETEKYGVPQSTHILQHDNRLGLGGSHKVNIDTSFNVNTQSNVDEVQTKMGMELHSGHLKSRQTESEDYEYDYVEEDVSVSSKSQSGISNLRNQQKPENRQLYYKDIDDDLGQTDI